MSEGTSDRPPFFGSPEGLELPFEFEPIPEDLFSAYSKAPFEKCSICSVPLEEGRLYEIQKAYHGTEVIFEMAVCQACGEKAAEEFSAESTEAIRAYFFERFRVDRPAEACKLCGRVRDETLRFSLCGVCLSDHMIAPIFLVCEGCEEELQELLSEKTRSAQDDFIQSHFPGVPADFDLAPQLFFG